MWKNVCLIKPFWVINWKVFFDFLLTSCIWVDHDRLVFTVTPKSLVEEHVSIRESLRWNWGWAFTTRQLLPLDVMNKTLDLVEFIDMLFCLHQVSTWDKSYERVVSTSSKDLLCTDKVVFSANMSGIEFDNESGSGRSLMWIKNKIGPRTEPWGTLAVTSPGFDCSPDMQVIWVLGL